MSDPPRKKIKYNEDKVHHKAFTFYAMPKIPYNQYLAPGMKGFFATCNFHEKDCVREAYNILNEAADELYGSKKSEANKETEKIETSDDIADQLQKEVDAAKNNKEKIKPYRFQQVGTAVNNCVFIQTNVLNPVDLASHIVEDIKSSGKQKTRYLLRLIPVEVVCRINDLKSVADDLFNWYFSNESSTFSIVYNKRYNKDVKREKIIQLLAELIESKNAANRVDLKNPEKSVVVEIVKGLCLLSVVPGYLQNKKYNLVELACASKVNKQEEPEKSEIESKNGEQEDDDDADESL